MPRPTTGTLTCASTAHSGENGGPLPDEAHLVVVFSDNDAIDGQTLRLSRPTVTIGRRADADGIGLGDKRVSSRHAQIRKERRIFSLTDLGSRNGTFINGTPIAPSQEATLSDGDVIRVGETVLLFRAGTPTDAQWDDPLLPGRAASMCSSRDYVRRIAPLDVHVLLLGETGTGKEYAARALHGLSSRGNEAFVPVNCGEFNKSLARAELFGAESGAFTDARKARVGLVATAAGGTLFLDEIGDLDLAVQVDLIRFLQDGTYRTVGGSQIRQSDARVVAATNVDLERAVDEGRFRLDLLARLRNRVPPVRLPSLRERREDLIGWVRRFIAEDAATLNRPLVGLTAGFAESILLHPWRENLRELRMAVGSALLSPDADDTQLRARDLPESVAAARRQVRRPRGASTPTRMLEPRPSPVITRPKLTHAALVEALEAHEGVVVRAAAALGIERQKLYRLCRKYGVNYTDFRAVDDPDV